MLKQPYFWLVLMLSGAMFASVYIMLGQSELPLAVHRKPPSLAPGDQEVAWLNPATNYQAWIRFVAAMHSLKDRYPDWGIEIVDTQAFPEETAALPAVGLRRKGFAGTLWLRWYKLTGQVGTREWLELLRLRNPPPLAFVGGGSSDRARDLAVEVNRAAFPAEQAPLLFFTTATADEVVHDGQLVELITIYPHRSFRFCFTNQQMADSLLQFIWDQPNLRPSEGPAYLFAWRDDPYSVDLMEQFRRLLTRIPAEATDLEQSFRFATATEAFTLKIPFSISALSEPNQREAAAVNALAQAAAEHEQESALLVVPAEVKPTRRVLRTLYRNDPTVARRFVVTVGDAVEFNALYRDRRADWPIQELPYPLLLFCHRNPILPEAGFASEAEAKADPTRSPTSTEDLLLYGDVARVLLETAFVDGRILTDPSLFGRRLRDLDHAAPNPRFDRRGNRRQGTGEFLVLLEPKWAGERVLPLAQLSVFSRSDSGDAWTLYRQLDLEYGPATAHPTAEDEP